LTRNLIYKKPEKAEVKRFRVKRGMTLVIRLFDFPWKLEIRKEAIHHMTKVTGVLAKIIKFIRSITGYLKFGFINSIIGLAECNR